MRFPTMAPAASLPLQLVGAAAASAAGLAVVAVSLWGLVGVQSAPVYVRLAPQPTQAAAKPTAVLPFATHAVARPPVVEQVARVGIPDVPAAETPIPAAETPIPAAPELTRDIAEQQLLQRLDAVWGRDTPETLRLLDEFVGRFPSDRAVDEKLYAALIARAGDVAAAEQTDSAIQLLGRAAALLPDRQEAALAQRALTQP